MGNPDLDLDFRFLCNRTRNPKTDFTTEKSVLRVDFNSGIQFRISWISFLPFDWEIRTRICKTVLENSGLLFANYACACKTAVGLLRTVFQILFRISQLNGKNENPKTDNLSLKFVFGFRVRLQIRNPDFKILIRISQSNAP